MIAVGAATLPAVANPQSEAPEVEGFSPVSYEADLVGAPSAKAEDLLKASLKVFRFQEEGAPSIPMLRGRATADVDIGQRVMRSLGYYEATFETNVAAREGQPAMVTVRVMPGRPFTLASHRFDVSHDLLSPPPDLTSAEKLGSPVGAAARAEAILEAEAAAIRRLKRQGYPYAEQSERDAVMNPEEATLEVNTSIAAGRQYRYGELSFDGIPDVEETYLRTYVPWEAGHLVDLEQLAAYQRRLIETGLFAAGSVTLPEEPPDGEAAPIQATMEQRPFRTVAAGARYSTDVGPGVKLEFQHRNLFGANETFKAVAETGFEEQRLDLSYIEPQFGRAGQDLIAGVSLRNLTTDAFDETAATFTLGLERELTPNLVVGAGGLIEITITESADSEGTAYLGGLPAFAEYISTDDPLNPTEGWVVRANATPFLGHFDENFVPFLNLETSASTYFALDGDARYVLAVRGRAGSILAQELEDVPPGRRLYSGGGGSVRGYEERHIGPLGANGDPIGGLSVLEGGVEFRARVYGDFGTAVFLEAGSVAEDTVPTFEEGVQYAAGGGLRYFSPVGPIRVDVGVPLNPRRGDDNFIVYFSIGQAF